MEERLRGVAEKWPELRDAVGIYLAALPVLKRARLPVAPVRLSKAVIREKISRGKYLLSGISLDFDDSASRELVIRLAKKISGAGLAGMSRIARAIEEVRLVPSELLQFVANRDYMSLAGKAEEQSLSPPLLWALAECAIKPSLRALCRELAPLVPVSGWVKPACYVCGTPAHLGEFLGNPQAKHLRCGMCGSGWPVPRFKCIYCGCEDPSRIGFFSAEGRNGDGKTRVEACDACHGYLKVIRNFTPASPEELAVDDISTLHLDSIARKRGYIHPIATY